MKIFLASRFEEFKTLRNLLIERIKDELPKELNVEIVSLKPNIAKLKSAKLESEEGVEQSNFLLLLVGDSYGLVDKDTGLSITHLEYRKAIELSINIMAVYVGKYNNNLNFISENDDEKLKKFKKEVFPESNASYVYSSHQINTQETDKNIYEYENISKKITKNLFQLLGEILDDNSKKNKKSKKNIDKTHINLIHFVAFLTDYSLRLPISLAKKIRPKEWNDIKIIVGHKNNDFGIFVDGENVKNAGLYLALNEQGIRESEIFDNSDNSIIVELLVNCDMKQKNEAFLFTKLTIKQRYIQTIFNNFSHNLNYIIETDKYPSNDKLTLYYRLLAYDYKDKKLYSLMRESFKKCLFYHEKSKQHKSTSFYIDWAVIEEELNNYEKAKEIYEEALANYPYPANKNRSIRFSLSIYYYKEGNKNDALSLLCIDNFKLIKIPDFIYKVTDKIDFLITSGESENATILQTVIKDLSNYLRNKGEVELANTIIREITYKINNNDSLNESLIKSYIKTNPDRALIELKRIEKTNFYKSKLVALYMDYYMERKDVNTAIQHGKSYIRNNSKSEHLGIIYFKLALIYSNNNQWKRARTYFEKNDWSSIRNNYLYAISLMKTGGKETLNIFLNYFNDNKDTQNTKAISKFVEFCLVIGKKNIAQKYINNKFIQSKKYDYKRSFFSFLYQQQLKLTDNYDFSEMLLNSALDYARDDNQKAIIYSNYAKHLSYDEMDDTNAIKYFKISYSIKQDSLVLFDIAKCYYRLNEYQKCLDEIEKISTKNKQLKNNISLLQIKVYNKTQDYAKLESLVINAKLDNKSKDFLHLYLAEKITNDKKTRIAHYKESIKYSNSNYSKLKFAIFLYLNNKKNEGIELYREIEESLSNYDEKKKIYNEFNFSIGFNPIPKKIFISMEEDLSRITEWNQILLNRLYKLIKEYPFNDRLYGYLFEYYYKLKKFPSCFNVLDILIKNNQINHRTAYMFFEISKNQYEFSNFINFDNKGNPTINKKHQVIALIKAKEYIEYAIKADDANIEYLKLYSKILYKQGNFRKYKTANRFINKKYKQKGEEAIYYDELLKQRETIFLWPEINSDYYTKVKFYKMQEKNASTIVGNRDKNLPMAISILKSISSDTEFNEKNNFYLLRNITTRLGHIYYDIKKDFNKAFNYQKKVYKYKMEDLSFIGSFLNTISKLKKFEYGINICEEYLKIKRNSFILRHYGNFLKENAQFNESYFAYLDAISLEKDKKHKGILYNNILLLCKDSIESKVYFKSKSEILQISIESYNKLKKLYPSFKWIEDSTQSLNYIKKNA